MSEVTELDPLTFPLHGSRLIEASAGTGKTFTIALLYVRLVLGARNEQDDAAFSRPLTPPEILVVTFTNAATQELRERIRARLVEAAEVFQSQHWGQTPKSTEGSDPKADPLLVALRDQYDPAGWSACARRLQLAAEWMDEAAVSTIHSWCYRMLREHAFDSGSLFSLELETDQSELEQEVVRDYWRSFYYPLGAEALAEITQYWEAPTNTRASLHGAVRRLLPECDALPPDAPPPTETLATTQAERDTRLAELKAPWPAWLDELAPALEEAAKRKAFKGQSFNARNRSNWLGALRDWSQGEEARPALTPAAWKRLTPEGLAEIWQDGEPPLPAAWEALAELPAALEALPDPRADLLIHAVQWCRTRLEREQQRRAEMGPNDLLAHLDRALAGPSGEALAAQIRRQFPVALVDEFQDTDPVQYRIFDRVYRLADNARDTSHSDPHSDPNSTGVFLIGDPKQAIYAFRGADIHTYLQARRDTAGRHVTLGTNYRSSAAMVAAVNRCFAYAEAHPPGAFLFKQADGGNPVPFVPVKAKGRKDALVVDGQPQPALTLWRLDADEPLSKTAYHGEMAERCASQMVALLESGRRGAAGFHDGDAMRPLAPSDMAVLVNGLGEARAIRQALARRGVKSVYLSDKDKVFASPMAFELDAWLRACAESPSSSSEHERRLRAALATPTLGLGLAELDRLNQDELAWEARVLQFRDYHRLWQRQGVLPLVRRLMNDFEVPGRLLGGGPASDGERHLTDLLHLGELLQHASQELDGEHALIRFLAESIADPDDQGDAHKLRLESDADLVQVITIHKSKGLEYPLVFLPFICGHRATRADDSPLRWHDAEGRLRISLEADEATLALADRERLGEDLRKLYVALTRARHATWLGMAPLKGGEGSAIGQLLADGAPLEPAAAAFAPALEALKGDQAAIAIEPAPPATATLFRPDERQASLGEALSPRRPAREQWWIASYSALRTSGLITTPLATPDTAPVSTHLLHSAALHSTPTTAPTAAESPRDGASSPSLPEPTTSLEATAFEVLDEPRDSAAEPLTPSLHRFPRGPGPGTFLHGLLEWAGQHGFARASRDAAQREDMLARRTQLRGWTPWLATLNGWLAALLETPLPLPEAGRVRLGELGVYQVEMEFWFAASRVDTRVLDAPVSAHTLGGAPRPALDADTLNGMLKGFIDLVFEHRGRYYVLDWKSNHLGPNDDAYTPAAMRDAMLDKRYDLQATLYLLALHRLLKARLPDYDYDRHIGGSLTVFLRGVGSATAGDGRGVHAERPPRALIETLDALFQGQAPAATTHSSRAEAPQ
ncbi:exodeoxyribonuclease V subunit beta [Halomonas sp. M4R5S39]|uniref:exodeoxyribonuclease V subunit beta n=1 Tax=Halomonas kalidii TaxID=3043293 RepID=UPI0024A9747D|nr:exodeoxyribonuclease V subunit beta [Halomonas kalidii]MDI5983357.1 exodeoxyribonuclease V subunit beta [Halomonas kalidii]